VRTGDARLAASKDSNAALANALDADLEAWIRGYGMMPCSENSCSSPPDRQVPI